MDLKRLLIEYPYTLTMHKTMHVHLDSYKFLEPLISPEEEPGNSTHETPLFCRLGELSMGVLPSKSAQMVEGISP
jgi:hypothetical protein